VPKLTSSLARQLDSSQACFTRFSGLDHILAMVSVGVWGAQLGQPAIWILPVTFPIMMAFGGLVGFLGILLPSTELGTALSMVVLGGAVMLEARPPLPVVMALVAFFAIFHGHAHGTELPKRESALLYSLGFVLATGLLHLVGILIGVIGIVRRRRAAGRGKFPLGRSSVIKETLASKQAGSRGRSDNDALRGDHLCSPYPDESATAAAAIRVPIV
jgi:hydrogenase/urease accessory protein HupE